jgi:dTDP-4-amino-4,6-dideoxygalactose transaminase
MSPDEYRIPFNRATRARRDLEYLRRSLDEGPISGDGPFTFACQKYLESRLGVPKALLTTSCTHALELSAFLLDIQAGDEILMPSFTFVSTANAFVLRGGTPVFVDILPETLNLDPERLGDALSPRSRVIVPVHYGGVGCDMDEIEEVAFANDLSVVEDNAHGLFGSYRGKPLGTFGRLATLSFHETKNFTCGEGGALLINDESLIDRAEILREKGTNRRRFLRGKVEKYTWVDVGSSYLPSDLLAAMLLAQLEEADEIQARRERAWDFYARGLTGWADEHGVGLPLVPADRVQAFHLFYLVMPDAASRDALLKHLRRRGILAVFHYLPLHVSAMGRRFGGRPGDCPVTESVSSRLLRLPFFTDISESDQAAVVSALLEFRS